MLAATEASALATSPFNQNPIGTGPYKLASLDSSHALVRASDKYYLGGPSLTEIELRFFPDTSTAVASVVRGEAKGILLDANVSADDLDTVASVNALKRYEAIRTAYTILYLNNSQPPLNDVLVRQAIAETIDIDGLIDSVLGGRAARADSPIVTGTWANNPDLESNGRDVSDARSRLEKAGWTLPDNAQVRTRNGVELRLTLLTDRDSIRGRISGEIAKELADVGIAVTLAPEESTNLIRDAPPADRHVDRARKRATAGEILQRTPTIRQISSSKRRGSRRISTRGNSCTTPSKQSFERTSRASCSITRGTHTLSPTKSRASN